MHNYAESDSLDELFDVLRPFTRTTGPRYQSAKWLKSPFNSANWAIHSNNIFQLDWNVRLDDGELLTAPKHACLLDGLKSWLVAHTHVDTTGGRIFSPATERNMLMRTIHCIDYILLNARDLGVLEGGLAAVSENDLKAMLSTIGSHSTAAVAIYGWPDRLTRLLRSKINELPEGAIEHARSLYHDIDTLPPRTEDFTTDLHPDEVLAARAWLAINGLYKWAKNSFRLAPSTKSLAEHLYRSTIFGGSISLPTPVELCIGSEYRCVTEFPRANTRSASDIRSSRKNLETYLSSLSALHLLRQENIDSPSFSIDALRGSIRSLDSKRAGRYRTIPQTVAFGALRKAVEYVLEYGDALLDSYLAVANAASIEKQTIYAFSSSRDITVYLSEPCIRLGVKSWAIDPTARGPGVGPHFDPKQWYCELRKNSGLYEALQVLYGAMQVVVGLLSARRQGELVELHAGDCLDSTTTRLVFRNRKSGIGGMRNLEARPIPKIGARFIRMIESMQRKLVESGFIPELSSVFSPPRKCGPIEIPSGTPQRYNESLDLFCDWAELELDQTGCRYYLRQHQLRRFFAMLFFWGGGFGGMDTIRWFLGHTDAQHLWHYITECTPGLTLRSVAAEWVAHGVKHGSNEAEILGKELQTHFGTSDFTILEDEALVMHLEDLIDEGRLVVEPHFLDRGRSYRVCVTLRDTQP